MQRVFHAQQLVALALHHLADGDAGGARNDFGDLLGADLGAQQLRRGFLALVLAGLRLVQLLLQLRQLAVLQLGHLVEVALAGGLLHLELDLLDLLADLLAALGVGLFGLPDLVQVGVFLLQRGQVILDQLQALARGLVGLLLHRLALDLELDHAAVQPVHHLGLGVDLDLDLGRRLVDQVDRLVGQEAVGDVACTQLGRGHDGRVGDVDAMVRLITLLQAAEDGDGVLDGRLAHQHLLEAPLQRRVLLDVLAVFVQRGGADAVQLATRQRGLQHVAGVDGALCLAGADHGVQLVDEQNDAPFFLRHFLQHRLQALFKFTTVLGARQQARHVEHQHLLVLQRVGHLAGHDALGQAFDDGGLAHARLADQHRVVLAAPLQHLDGAADLVVAADHRVQLALARAFGQVERVFFERLALALAVGAVHGLAAAHGVDGGFQALAAQARLLRNAAGLALGVGQRQQEHLAGHELVAALDAFLLGGLQQADQVGAGLHLLLARHGGQALDGGLGVLAQLGHVDAGALQQRLGAILLAQHGRQQVHGFDVGVVVAQGQRLRVGQGFLELGGEFVESHEEKTSELLPQMGCIHRESRAFQCPPPTPTARLEPAS